MRYKLIIFDLDGTLADTSPGIFNSIRHTQGKMNLPPISIEKMKTHIGPPIRDSYNKNFGLTGNKLSEAVSHHITYANEFGFKEIIIYDGIIDLLNYIKLQKSKLAIATLKAKETAIKMLKHHGLLDKFDIIQGMTPGYNCSKSDLILNCVSESQISPKETILIGDSEYDLIGAQKAGINFIGVTYGFGFKANQTDRRQNIILVNSVSEILRHII